MLSLLFFYCTQQVSACRARSVMVGFFYRYASRIEDSRAERSP